MLNKNRLFSLILFGLIITLIVFYLSRHPSLFFSLKNISFLNFFVLVWLRFFFMALNGRTLKLLLAKFEVHLTLQEWVGLPIVTTLGNYIAPLSAGMVVRAAYLKKRHTFAYTQFASILAANYLVNYWLVGVVGVLFSLTLLGAPYFSWAVTFIFGMVVVVISVLTLAPEIKLPDYGRVTQLIDSALKGWYLIKSDRKLLGQIVLNIALLLVIHALSFWVAYGALHVVVPFRAAILVSSMMMFSLLFNITPGNFGIPEMIATITSGLLNAGSAEALLATLLIRVATVSIAFTLGPVFSVRFKNELAKINAKS